MAESIVKDPGFQSCVDAGGKTVKKQLTGGLYKHICFFKGKAYHSDIKSEMVTRAMDKTNKNMGDQAQEVGSHNQ